MKYLISSIILLTALFPALLFAEPVKNRVITPVPKSQITSTTQLKNYPNGSIKTFDHTLNREMPVAGVRIEVESQGKRYTAFTDSSGYFSFPSLIGKWVSYRLVWQYRGDAFHIRSNAVGPAECDGPKSASCWNPVFRDGKQQFYATIFRAGSTYLSADFVTPANQFEHIAIKAYPNLKPFGKGSARHNALFETIQIWGKSKAGKSLSDIRLFGYVAHELAHAHHDHFYPGVSQHLMTELRLKESWAEGVRYSLIQSEYGDSFEESKVYSKQLPFFSGWRNFNWGKKKKYFYNYTPLMIDLMDTLDQDHLDDRVSGYTLTQIQKIMENRDCRGFDSFKRMLKARYDNPTEQYLDILFREMEAH